MPPTIVRFEAKRSLLNPGFEGYKLSTAAEDHFRCYPIALPSESLQACVYLDALSELQVIAYRVQLNGLLHSPLRPHDAFYFDAEHALWLIQLGEEEIIEQLIPPPTETAHSCYPSAQILPHDLILLLRGDGRHLGLFDGSTGSSLGQCALPAELHDSFCCIEAVHSDKDWETAIRARIAISQLVARREDERRSHFVIHLFDLCWPRGASCPSLFSKVASYRSKSRPLIVQLDSEGLIIGANAPFAPEGERSDPASTSPAGTNPAGTGPAGTNPAGTSPAGTNSTATSPTETDSVETKSSEAIANLATGDVEVNPTASGDNSESHPSSALYSIALIKYASDEPEKVLWRSTSATHLGPYIDASLDDTVSCALTLSEADDALAYVVRQRGGARAEHVCSYDALSFIQAGKQDRRYCLFVPGKAFIVESSQLVYIYEPPANRSSKTARQFLLQLDSAETVRGWALLGGHTLLLLGKSQLYLIRF